MKRRFSILLHIFLLLALSACGVATPSPSPTPSPTATTQPTRLPDPVEEVGRCPSGAVAAPDVVDTWSPPPEAASITPLSCDEIGEVFAYDLQAPLDIQEVSRRREEGVTVIDLTYASPMGGRVPATLVVPDGAGPFAGMLYQHGMPSTRQPMIPAAVNYARMGAVVLLIDAPFARRSNGMNAPVTMTEQDRGEQIQLIVDLRRGVDLLLSRPDVDPERMAYVGISYGGAMGGLLAGVEDRLQAYALQVGDGGLVTHFTGPEDRAAWLAMAEDQRRQWVAWMWPIEPIHYVGCASPAALLFQNCTLDAAVPPADGLRYQEAGSEPKTVCWYRAGHPLDATADYDQAEWLSERIGISMLMTACSTPAPTPQPPTPTPIPSGMVDVGGYELFYECSGQGSPTVILEAGMGSGSYFWTSVIAGVAETTRVCAYDRANLSRSDKARTPRTFQDAARDLQALLENARFDGPYILVGHSLGGELVRVFADQYPEEVAGIVLVDAAHPDMGPRLLAGLPPESADEPENVMLWRQLFTWISDSSGSPYPNPEGWDTQAGNAQVRGTKPLGDMPLVVISQSPDNPLFAANIPPSLAETNSQLQQIWQDLQVELAGLSTNSTHVIAARASHNIPIEEPAMVVDAILELANEIQSR